MGSGFALAGNEGRTNYRRRAGPPRGGDWRRLSALGESGTDHKVLADVLGSKEAHQATILEDHDRGTVSGVNGGHGGIEILPGFEKHCKTAINSIKR